jgi:hypothetical protein
LEIPQLDMNRAFSFSPRLFRAYADALLAVGRTAEAETWQGQAAAAESALGIGEDADPFIFDLAEEDEEETKPKKRSTTMFNEDGEAITPVAAPVAKRTVAAASDAARGTAEVDDAEADYFESDDAESDEFSADDDADAPAAVGISSAGEANGSHDDDADEGPAEDADESSATQADGEGHRLDD